jgi:hypothetical protein
LGTWDIVEETLEQCRRGRNVGSLERPSGLEKVPGQGLQGVKGEGKLPAGAQRSTSPQLTAYIHELLISKMGGRKTFAHPTPGVISPNKGHSKAAESACKSLSSSKAILCSYLGSLLND